MFALLNFDHHNCNHLSKVSVQVKLKDNKILLGTFGKSQNQKNPKSLDKYQLRMEEGRLCLQDSNNREDNLSL